jgi:hypothetical protein
LLALFALIIVSQSAAAQIVRVAYAKPRGFFPGAGFGRIEIPVPLTKTHSVFVAGEVYIASHENVSSTTFSGYAMLRNDPFPRAILSPFAAIGVGAHAIRSRTTLQDVRTLTVTETSAKGHFWAGVRLPGLAGVRPVVETRWTVPSKYVFDYIAAGISF